MATDWLRLSHRFNFSLRNGPSRIYDTVKGYRRGKLDMGPRTFAKSQLCCELANVAQVVRINFRGWQHQPRATPLSPSTHRKAQAHK